MVRCCMALRTARRFPPPPPPPPPAGLGSQESAPRALAGVSVQDGAIVVDMTLGFAGVAPSAADPTVFCVGGGARLGPTYLALWRHGQRASPGGTCPTNGAGGPIQGAGPTWTASLPCDEPRRAACGFL